MVIKRDLYLNKLISVKHNGMIKIITGIRRCGKSFLLSNLYTAWLKEHGVDTNHIININLEDRRNRILRDPDVLLQWLTQCPFELSTGRAFSSYGEYNLQ